MKDYNLIFRENGFINSRMITASKSSYRKAYPNNQIVFNANIITEKSGKVWYGDLDITKDKDMLKKIASELGETLYVLYEMDCRFSTEKDSIETLIKKSVWNTEED